MIASEQTSCSATARMKNDKFQFEVHTLKAEVVATETISDSSSKKIFTLYTIQFTLKCRPTGAIPISTGVNVFTSHSSGAPYPEHDAVNDDSNAETVRVAFKKRYSDIYEYKRQLERSFGKVLRENHLVLSLPDKVFTNRNNLDISTIEKRSKAFTEFFQSLLQSSQLVREQVLDNQLSSQFFYASLQSSCCFLLRMGNFSAATSELRTLLSFVRLVHQTDASMLSLRILLSLVVAHTHVDSQTMATSVLDELKLLAQQISQTLDNQEKERFRMALDSNSGAGCGRELLLLMAAKYAESAWCVLEFRGAQIFTDLPQQFSTYRDALACAIEWLAAQLNDTHLRARFQARCGIHRPDAVTPRANISALYELVIHNNMP